MAVEVKLREATPVTGGLLFEMLSEPVKADPNAPRPRLGVRRQFKDGGNTRGGPPRKGGPGFSRAPGKPGKGGKGGKRR
jgi:ribonuclease R